MTDTRSTAEKVWEVLLKATVPISIVAAGALIRHEVIIASQGVRVSHLEQREIPPDWFREDVNEIKDRLGRIETRLLELERGK